MSVDQRGGFSLAEVMVALGISSMVFLAGSAVLDHLSRFKKHYLIRESMESVANRIERILQNPQNLAFSAALRGPTNQALRGCIFVNQSEGCTALATDPKTPLSFVLIPATNRLENAAIVSGTATEPVRYTHEGRPCLDGAANPIGQNSLSSFDRGNGIQTYCPIVARTYFWATCLMDKERAALAAGGVPTLETRSCDRAETIHVTYQVRYEDPAVGDSSNFHAKEVIAKRALPSVTNSIPLDEDFWQDPPTNSVQRSYFAFDIQTSSIQYPKKVMQMCGDDRRYVGSNWTLIGVKQERPGSPAEVVCGCFYPNTQVSTNRGLECRTESSQCAPNERYMGTRTKESGGVMADCRELGEQWFKTEMTDGHFSFDCSQSTRSSIESGTHPWVCGVRPVLESGGGSNCECAEIENRSSFGTYSGSWEFRCRLQCAFEVKCCWPQSND